MILNSEALFESCLIKTSKPQRQTLEEQLGESNEVLNIKMHKTPGNPVESLETPIEVLEELSNQIIKNDIKLGQDTSLQVEFADEPENNETFSEIETEELADVEEDEEEEEEAPRIPLTLGSEIQSMATVRFKDSETEHLNGLEEIDFDIIDDELKEVDLISSMNSLDANAMKLKKPNQVYYEIYKQARKKAKHAKKEAIMAFLEAKNIKKTYLLDDLDESDSDNSDLDNIEEFA
jgi:hypothetical protein